MSRPNYCVRCGRPRGGGTWCIRCHKVVVREMRRRPPAGCPAEPEPPPPRGGEYLPNLYPLFAARKPAVRFRADEEMSPGQEDALRAWEDAS